jgi:hypothetical protein
MSLEAERLPCRGCTRSCENYDRCDGRPWRLREQLTQSLLWAGLGADDRSAENAGESLAA